MFDLDERNKSIHSRPRFARLLHAAGQAKKLGGWADRLLENGGLDLVECACLSDLPVLVLGEMIYLLKRQNLKSRRFKPERNRAWHITRHSNFWKLASLEIWVSNLVGELPYNIRRYQK